MVLPEANLFLSGSLGISRTASNLNGFSFNQAVGDSQGCVINTWVDTISRANLGMEGISLKHM